MKGLISRLSARAEHLAVSAAYATAVEAVAARDALPADAVRTRAAPRAAALCRRRLPASIDSRLAVARDTAIYLTTVHFGHGVRATARAAGLAPKNALMALRRVEERRDCPEQDRALDELELTLMGDAAC
jgi:thiamine monophosphate synthase